MSICKDFFTVSVLTANEFQHEYFHFLLLLNTVFA